MDEGHSPTVVVVRIVDSGGNYFELICTTYLCRCRSEVLSHCNLNRWHLSTDGIDVTSTNGRDRDLAKNHFCCPSGYVTNATGHLLLIL